MQGGDSMRKCIFAIAALLFAATACDSSYVPGYDDGYRQYYLMTVRNTSDADINLFIPEHGDVDCSEVTGALPDSLTTALKNSMFRVDAKSSIRIYVDNSGIISPIETYHPEDKVTFYFFDRQVLADSTWKTIVEQELWLKKVSLSAGELIDANKVLTY